jgi:beta-phosphoglucomutase-like phosphatase (HAD superfamily)
LSSFEVIFWGFDGTIKNTNSIKADAFEKLFCGYGVEFFTKSKRTSY